MRSIRKEQGAKSEGRPARREALRRVSVFTLRSLPFALCAALPVLCPLLLAAAADGVTEFSTPAVNWVLPLFTDQDGYRSMTLRGATVKPAGANGIAVTELNVTVFSGDAAARVETVLLSQDATFYTKDTRVTGEKNVRVLRDELEVTGENWSYDHNGKKVSIRKNVRVVYRAPLKIPL
jgi:hypothetical protein